MRRGAPWLVMCLLGCGSLKARCVDSADDDGGTGSPSELACQTKGGDVPTLAGNVLIACGAEVLALRTCTWPALGTATCEDGCAVVERAQPLCSESGEPSCSDDSKVTCEFFPLPDDDDCKTMLSQCSRKDRVVAPTEAGNSSVAGCAFNRGFAFVREVEDLDAGLP